MKTKKNQNSDINGNCSTPSQNHASIYESFEVVKKRFEKLSDDEKFRLAFSIQQRPYRIAELLESIIHRQQGRITNFMWVFCEDYNIKYDIAIFKASLSDQTVNILIEHTDGSINQVQVDCHILFEEKHYRLKSIKHLKLNPLEIQFGRKEEYKTNN